MLKKNNDDDDDGGDNNSNDVVLDSQSTPINGDYASVNATLPVYNESSFSQLS
jgi:hypothetical protein